MLFSNFYLDFVIISLLATLVIMCTVFTFMAYIYMVHPDKLLKAGLKLARSFSGMSTIHYVPRKTGNGVWCYAERGSKKNVDSSNEKLNKSQTLVFIHGFGADKDMWPSIVKRLPADYHCILVDLPGHGETTFLKGYDDPSVEGYVKSLREFFEVTGLDSSKVNLIGCSFGGGISALFCYYHSECIENLILMCPAVKTPILTKTCQDLFDGNYEILIPSTGAKFVSMIQLLTYKQRYYPAKMMSAFVNLNFHEEKQEFLKTVLYGMIHNDLQRFDEELASKIGQIQNRTLIVWGKNDELLHFSGAEMLSQIIVNSELRMIDKCNHVMHIDQPKIASSHIVSFIKSQNY